MNAVIYARYSSDNQREESIEGQLRECKEYADQNGITVVRTYIDRALSAKTDSRPQFQQMIHDSATHTTPLRRYWCGNWTAFPATGTTQPTISASSKTTGSMWCR